MNLYLLVHILKSHSGLGASNMGAGELYRDLLCDWLLLRSASQGAWVRCADGLGRGHPDCQAQCHPDTMCLNGPASLPGEGWSG